MYTNNPNYTKSSNPYGPVVIYLISGADFSWRSRWIELELVVEAMLEWFGVAVGEEKRLAQLLVVLITSKQPEGAAADPFFLANSLQQQKQQQQQHALLWATTMPPPSPPPNFYLQTVGLALPPGEGWISGGTWETCQRNKWEFSQVVTRPRAPWSIQ